MNVLTNLLDGPGITIFGFKIYFYAMILVSGMIVASILSGVMMRRRNISSDWVLTFFIFCIPGAIIGARLYYCITKGLPLDEWIGFRDGGLSIIGGVSCGVLTGLVVCLIKKVNFLRFIDCVAVNIPLAQAIGRWGNFVNGEVYGQEITNPSLQFFPFGVEVNGNWYQALFFYESVLNLIVFSILFTLAWKCYKKPNGIFGCVYFSCYGLIRTVMEPMRNPQYILGSEQDIMWSQISAISFIFIGLIGVAILLYLNYRKEGAWIGSKTGDPYAITQFIPCYAEDKPNYNGINAMKNHQEGKECLEKQNKKTKN